jgi:hypothetical protein
VPITCRGPVHVREVGSVVWAALYGFGAYASDMRRRMLQDRRRSQSASSPGGALLVVFVSDAKSMRTVRASEKPSATAAKSASLL